MSESDVPPFNALPKKHPRRTMLASTLRGARRAERYDLYVTNRGAIGYAIYMKGYKALYDHARHIGVPRVLDLGVGSGHGVDEISRLPFSKGVVFEGTSLYPKKRHNDIPVHITSGENMSRLPACAYGVVQGVFSVAYSSEPERIAVSTDRLLAPGGCFKFVCKLPGRKGVDGAPELHTPDFFKKAFEELGYTVYINGRIIMGVKPGGSTERSAQELYEADERTLSDQLAAIATHKGFSGSKKKVDGMIDRIKDI